MKIPLIKPFINDDIKNRVLAVMESGLLTEGRVTKEFEDVCRKYLDCGNCIAVTSCTVGLEMALRCLGIGPGDEVIIPDYTYPATADAVAIVGARPVIVDINPNTMLIDYKEISAAITSQTKAIIPVSLFGNPLDYEILAEFKRKFGLFVIEDAACSLGAEYNKKKVGCFADISVFSLHPRKFITTGEGGLVTTKSDSWAEWLSSYKKFGMVSDFKREKTVFARIGSNYKLSDLLSALGVGQMQYIDVLLSKRRALAANYKQMLSDVPGITLPGTTKHGVHSYQSFCILVKNRDYLLNQLRSQEIEVQIGTYSLHLQPVFQNNDLCEIRGDLKGSRYAYEHCMALPLYHDMGTEDQEQVVRAIKKHLI